ncbi:hypothetical protein LP419_30500 [Massilia sp. H-1]|nr:hypothetical protein LP419_30500 [Massilia sp. H-1]
MEEKRNAVNESKDQLKLSKANTEGKAGAEDRIAKERALAEANARVKELERNVSELEKLMVIKNKAAADAAAAAAAKSQPAKPGAVLRPLVVPPAAAVKLLPPGTCTGGHATGSQASGQAASRRRTSGQRASSGTGHDRTDGQRA